MVLVNTFPLPVMGESLWLVLLVMSVRTKKHDGDLEVIQFAKVSFSNLFVCSNLHTKRGWICV